MCHVSYVMSHITSHHVTLYYSTWWAHLWFSGLNLCYFDVLRFSPFLNGNKRALLADCALPVSVLTMSILGSFVFKDVKCEFFLSSLFLIIHSV